MQMTPYLSFGGKCAEAFEFYRQHLGATDVVLMPFKGSPAAEQCPPEWHDKIVHGSLRIGGNVLMGSDGMPGQPFHGMLGCSISLGVATPDEADKVFTALAQGGSITMPIGPTFFASKFGMVRDQFGVSWMVISEAPAQ